MYSIVSSSGNNYIFNAVNRTIHYLHPFLLSGENEYYQRKRNYFKEKGLLKEKQLDYTLLFLSKEDVERNFIETPQILFEVTDKCNLKCKYCGYGELYDNYDKRENKNLNFDIVKSFLNFYYKTCSEYHYRTPNPALGFYGGEPLLNFELIEKTINYIESHMKVIPRCNMTTNALLLDRYMDFLVDKKFNLLISLDGDRFASSYRVDYNHENLYNKIIYNINLLRETYPDYYSKNVNFNAVLHNRNTEDGVYDYFNKEYQKEPFLSSLNPSGINPLKKDDFDKIQNKDYCMKKVISSNSRFKRKVLLEYSQFFYNNLFSYYSNYLDLLAGSSNTKWINPTATCLPFAKKIFVTVNGKIYPCEKIGQEHPLGIIQNNDVKIDFEEIANWYNGLYENIYKNECKGCSFFSNCVMCLYFFRDKKCPMNAHKDVFRKELKEKIDFLEQNRNLYLDLENTELR